MRLNLYWKLHCHFTSRTKAAPPFINITLISHSKTLSIDPALGIEPETSRCVDAPIPQLTMSLTISRSWFLNIIIIIYNVYSLNDFHKFNFITFQAFSPCSLHLG